MYHVLEVPERPSKMHTCFGASYVAYHTLASPGYTSTAKAGWILASGLWDQQMVSAYDTMQESVTDKKLVTAGCRIWYVPLTLI